MATCRWPCSMQHSACRAVSCHRPCGVGDRSESPVSGRCFRLAPFSPSSTRCHRCRVTQMARGFTIECDGGRSPCGHSLRRRIAAPRRLSAAAAAWQHRVPRMVATCSGRNDIAICIPSESVRRREWPRGMRPRHFRYGRNQLPASAGGVHWQSKCASPGRSRSRQLG